ncbi:MAG: hypothetical protein H6Q56_153 [Deltaproteobacteria bacterium]|nr:hypothetical protein [Deltaproteobacteria bacterium]
MKKMVALLSGALLMLTAGVASAYTINYTYNPIVPTDGGFSTPYAGMQVETFDTAPLLWTWTGSYQIKTGSSSNGAAPAYLGNPDLTKYIAVPYVPGNSFPSGSVLATANTVVGGPFNYLGLWWGSIDGVQGGNNIWNEIRFYLGANLVETVTGDQVTNPADGSWIAGTTNQYVNLLNLPLFDSFELYSHHYAFEADNIAVGNVVPEPGTILLLGAGLFGLGIFSRRRMQK